MLEIGNLIQIKIERMASSGLGVGFYVSDTKRAVFVEGSCPEDVLEVEITAQKKVYFEAKIIKIITPSKYRIDPVCKHFGDCGGCNWLNINYDKQLEEKKQILSHFFQKVGLPVPEIKIIPSEKQLFYRDRVKKVNNGFYKKQSKIIVPISKCYIINDKFNEEIFSQKDNIFGYDYKKEEVTTKKAFYYYDDFEMKYLPKSFVQANLSTNKKLIEEVLNNVEGNNVLELYSGNGNLTLPISRKVTVITAVEGDGLSQGLLVENILRNNVSNVKSLKQDSHIFVLKSQKKWDCVIIDPPRTGTRDLLSKLKTNILIYVSCNPDLAIKEAKRYGWTIKNATIIDMFPQTHHFEVVFKMVK